jgi:transcriptional regulator with XRE-family HTH domain
VISLNERVKLIRKTLKLKQDEFGNRLGVTKASISRLEAGINNLTDQMVKSICREFDVNENWLRNGSGDMFQQLLPEDEYVKAAAEISKDDDEKIIQQVINEYWKLNPEAKKHIKEYIFNIANSIKKEE